MPVSLLVNSIRQRDTVWPFSAILYSFSLMYYLFLTILVLQIAPIYLTSCMKQGLGLLENLLYKQHVQNHQVLLKVTVLHFGWILLSLFAIRIHQFGIEVILMFSFDQSIEICRLNGLDYVSHNMMKVCFWASDDLCFWVIVSVLLHLPIQYLVDYWCRFPNLLLIHFTFWSILKLIKNDSCCEVQ